MSTENEELVQEEEIPEDAVVIKQVTWAWLWSSAPWIAAIFLLYSLLGIEPIFASVFLIMVILPRYWQWRRTAYILTDDDLIYQRGGLLSSRKYRIPFARMEEVKSREGVFGRGLGYQAVDIVLENHGVASLTYVPQNMGVAELIRERIGEVQPEPGDPHNGGGTVGSSPSTNSDSPSDSSN